MKRDYELIRKLLLFFEEREDSSPVQVPPIEGYNEETIKYHCVLMHDADLLRCEPVKATTSDRVIMVIPFELTWDGHEFLDKIRSDTVWQKIRAKIEEKGGNIPFDLMVALAMKHGKQFVGLGDD